MMETDLYKNQKQMQGTSNDNRYRVVLNYLRDIGSTNSKTYDIKRLEYGLNMLKQKGISDERIGTLSIIIDSYKTGIIKDSQELKTQLGHLQRRFVSGDMPLEYRVAN